MKNILIMIALSLTNIMGSTSLCANDKLLTNMTLGKVKVSGVLKLVSELDRVKSYELVLRTADEKTVASVTLPTMEDLEYYGGVQVIDINGDKYDDIVLPYLYGASPIAYTHLWIFNRKKKTFEHDSTFPGNGFPNKSDKKGCFTQERRIGAAPYKYIETTICYNKKKNEWENKGSKQIAP